MNFFDQTIMRAVNALSQHSWAFDHLVVRVCDNTLLKGGVMVALFWWAWFRYRDQHPEKREYLLFGLFASVSTVVIARVLATALPFRMRPLDNPLLGFQLPGGMNPNELVGWSSFPSDHAALFFCFAAGLWMVSKRLGSLAFCYALFVISLPRVYLGIHYPTDIIAGAVLGIGVAFLGKITWLRKGLTRPMLRWSESSPAAFSAGMFIFTFEIAELFVSLRQVGISGLHGVVGVLQALR